MANDRKYEFVCWKFFFNKFLCILLPDSWYQSIFWDGMDISIYLHAFFFFTFYYDLPFFFRIMIYLCSQVLLNFNPTRYALLWFFQRKIVDHNFYHSFSFILIKSWHILKVFLENTCLIFQRKKKVKLATKLFNLVQNDIFINFQVIN